MEEDRIAVNSASEPGPIYPFRWNVRARSQLGSLVGEPSGKRDEWLNWQEVTADAYGWRDTYTYEWFLSELTRHIARIVALCDDSDLCFVGRSPESMFDYLSGLLFETSWAERLTLLNLSMRWESHADIARDYPGALREIRRYLAWVGLNPEALVARERPIAFVDIVSSGGTLGNFIGLIYSWCKEIGFDWSEVQRKIRIVGLTEQTKTSPKTWRWQQHAEWVEILAPRAIKNVSVPEVLFDFLGAGQPKTTISYRTMGWGMEWLPAPIHDRERLRAIRVAVSLFDDGKGRGQRLSFAAELSKQRAIRYRWFRSLMLEVKG